MKIRAIFIVSLGLIALILSLFWYEWAHAPILDGQQNSEQMILGLRSPEGQITMVGVEIADEPDERRHGLMGRTFLEPGQGMLFIFDREESLSFWMKNTLIPLDILFFDAKGTFVSRTTMEPCKSDPCPSYPSEGPASYALEVEAGIKDLSIIGSGWTMILPKN
jgi:uncharacterized membrane protein (UPF0127 family)